MGNAVSDLKAEMSTKYGANKWKVEELTRQRRCTNKFSRKY